MVGTTFRNELSKLAYFENVMHTGILLNQYLITVCLLIYVYVESTMTLSADM